jgi:hypothetical protein
LVPSGRMTFSGGEIRLLGAVAVVDIEGCRIRGISKCTYDECPLYAEFVGEDAEKRASEDHQAVRMFSSVLVS